MPKFFFILSLNLTRLKNVSLLRYGKKNPLHLKFYSPVEIKFTIAFLISSKVIIIAFHIFFLFIYTFIVNSGLFYKKISPSSGFNLKRNLNSHRVGTIETWKPTLPMITSLSSIYGDYIGEWPALNTNYDMHANMFFLIIPF